jgi:hypothetical protein
MYNETDSVSTNGNPEIIERRKKGQREARLQKKLAKEATLKEND